MLGIHVRQVRMHRQQDAARQLLKDCDAATKTLDLAPLLESPTHSIFGWMFDVIDDHNIDGPALGFQLQPELLLKRRKY
jgi:hypothetical protein